MRRPALVAFCIALLLSISGASADRMPAHDPKALLTEYIIALKQGDWDRAESCWTPDQVAHSKRLGIHYPESPLKIDCASPVVTNLDGIVSGQVNLSITEVPAIADSARLTVRLASSTDTLETTYYAVKSDDEWRLISRLDALTQSWRRVETEYAIVHYADSSLINDFALRALDSTITGLLDLFKISESRRELFTDEKLDYYICSKSQFATLTGHDAHGVTDFPSDAVVARHLPHAHELSHLMMNFALEEAPLRTIPFMQEGFAVAVGGRWGKSPAVIEQLGHFLIAGGVCNLEDLLTYDGFRTRIGMPDISYPAAGIVAGLLLDRCGIEGFEQLYRELSGSNEDVRSLTLEAVKDDLKASTGWSWEELAANVDSFSNQFESSGIDPDNSELPATPMVEMKSGDLVMSVWEDGDDYHFRIRSATGNPRGVLLLADDEAQVRPSYRSWMFAEQLPDENYRGDRYGICFDPNETGFYDYYLNLLNAKFISMFDPLSSYWNADDSTICFSIRKSLLGRDITDYKLTLVPRDED